MKDWVANYEISDYFCKLQAESIKNIWYFRNVAYDHPEQLKKITDEEAERLTEELQFKGEGYFFERFYPERRLMTIAEFQYYWNTEENQNKLFVIDLLGHYAVVVPDLKGEDKLIYLLDTTKAGYINNLSFLKLCDCIL